MKKKIINSIILLLLFISNEGHAQQVYDIVVYGATSGGVIAAYTAKKEGKSVLLIEPGKHVGGLTTGGLGYTDIGNKYAITGISRDFYRRIGQHYGKFEQWIFEPHVAEQIFLGYLKSAKVNVLYQHRLVSVKKKSGFIKEITIENSDKPGRSSYKIIRATIFIDCSYEGDLMAKAGVSYVTGREANSMYNETYNGVQLRERHQFPDSIDPYRVPGYPQSGLLWGISAAPLDFQGAGDKKIQTYNFRICLTNNPSNRITITKPNDYNASHYGLLLRYLEKKPAKDLESFLNINLLPNHKTDINNNGPFSTDMIGMNYAYPAADYATRGEIQQAHESYTKGLLYFIGHDERMPLHLRKLMLQWGYPKDEYTNNGNFSPQMYVREARRMKGEYVMTQANCESKEVVSDGIGMAAYTMDSHNCQRIVVNGMVKNEGNVEIGGFGPYPISYRSIIPKANECKNLLVPVCLSATHIAYGSIRMEPVFMVLSQSAAMAAVLASDTKKTVQQIDINKLRQILKTNPLADNSTPEILVDNDDDAHVVKTGIWSTIHQKCYGPSAFTADGKTDSIKSVQFIPTIVKSGKYKVYSYYPKLENETSVTSIIVFDGKTKKEIVVRESDIQVEGQTSGEWVDLGTYSLPSGKKSLVEITNKHSDGVVVADAILFVPENK
ncbi:FAD-dependent oxidoreductase [Ginsengibacter hankyongi]|uniref:FAD-dependent oxidoreductase n=1 Tax=Ginsengibacter hankyongi TaxID=2607284 RepID=A0A5J5IGU2_9BACT|nr:FAD-dependent oxidoreductase [Ginsengibacter hankyongi]KAA9036561.1 FAD-dependent oxidoreductase [Ginsengibacter hankyongi]